MRDTEIWRFPALQDVKSSWLKAKEEIGGLPTMIQLEASGAPTNHTGAALVAEKKTARPALKNRSFHFVSAGPDFSAFGGHVAVGHSLEEIMNPDHAARITKIYENACDTGSSHIWRCINHVPNSPPMSYTRIVVPIRDDVGDGRCLFGVWIWHE